MAYSGDDLGILSDVAAVYKTLGLETMVTIMSEMGKVSTHLMVALVLLAISILLASSDNLSDRQVIKKEIFIQKLAAKMYTQIRWVKDHLKSYSVLVEIPPAPTGGPRSRVCARLTLRSAPLRH